ncbi:MAG: ABC transporter permease subunit [Azospirillaceae bacterium]|nr:ABC transporter permease subunit [Azospirillaceae bacterium]
MTDSASLATPDNRIAGRSLRADAMRRLLRNRAAVTSAIVLVLVTMACVAGPMFLPWALDDVDYTSFTTAPDFAAGHYFGTEANGRDLLVRTLYGGRISLLVGLVASLVSLIIGVSYGATAGYFGGGVDNIMMRVVDILYSLPFMFFVILLMVFFGRSITLMFVGIGAVEWLDMARIVRGQTLSLKRKEFIEAAEACGVSSAAIIFRHIVPNTLSPVIVYATLTVPRVIILESFLSFIGLGVQEPMTSWGVLVSEGAANMQNAPWMLWFPASFLAITLFCLNFLGDGLRDAFDPKDR